MQYFKHILSNNLPIIHIPTSSKVAYCGFAINTGSRDENENEYGYAHFIEHMLFKGTNKRKAWHILNRMERVGGELNAYTTKEETFIYSIFMSQDYVRAVELLSDLIINSQFPPYEIEKEREVVLDEIESYKDNPSELIFDEFENLIFDAPLGHPILGNKRTLCSFKKESGISFIRKHYSADNMVFFSMGNLEIKKIIDLAERFISVIGSNHPPKERLKPIFSPPLSVTKKKKTHQAHIIIGGKTFGLHDKRRIPLFLINNILGGPGMNSRLNISLREKKGLVYNVESNITSYTDTGLFSIYSGTDHKNKNQVIDLIHKELQKICNTKLSEMQLTAAKKQAIGQLIVASENNESIFLNIGKTFLHHKSYISLTEIFEKINSITSETLQDIANEFLKVDEQSILIYE